MTQDKEPRIAVNAQYIKDLSFENPNNPQMLNIKASPKIEFNMDLHIKPLDSDDYFEVALDFNVKATHEEKTLFVLELVYAGIFQMINMEEEQRQLLLGIHCPSLLFPYARNIISTTTQQGGFQPLMIEPIDFAKFYQKRMMEEQQKQEKAEDQDKK